MPLTIKEIESMDGKPVFVRHRAQIKFGSSWGLVDEWMIVDCKAETLRGAKRSVPFCKIYPGSAMVFRPEQEAVIGKDEDNG